MPLKKLILALLQIKQEKMNRLTGLSLTYKYQAKKKNTLTGFSLIYMYQARKNEYTHWFVSNLQVPREKK